ncbi:kinase-like protein [Lojkania enalia]|uniref:Kinase-like protein n=1 Tax=Lojkania enalia TaxID=147567 RepID=A0A9P4N5N1_9PLEO|nr:kinase-like protein [Didymosphaeria enalia]
MSPLGVQTTTMLQTLKNELRRHQYQTSFNTPFSFVPIEEVSTMLNAAAIGSVLVELDQPSDTAANHAQYILTSALKLFTILLYIGQEQEILTIVPSAWSDACLPIFFGESTDQEASNSNNPLQSSVSNWELEKRKDFETYQWLFLPARFIRLGQHLDLHDRCLLPFIQQRVIKEVSREKTIYAVKIHHQYQNMYHSSEASTPILTKSHEPEVAVKKFSASVYKNFEHEQAILNQLRHLNDHRIMTLLATYQFRGDYFIIMPLAECNLSEFWKRTDPTPDFQGYVGWFMNEITGMMSTLSRMHSMISSPTSPLPNSSPSPSSPSTGIFHGDIKPQNILLMLSNVALPTHPTQPILTLNDFGLSAWCTIPASPLLLSTRTYEAPETELSQNPSLNSDIWSLGCVILEFLIWLLQGSKGVERFATERIMETPGSGVPLKDDHFFMLEYEGGQTMRAMVRETVERWVQALYADEMCVGMVREVLGLVVGDMLVVEHEKRASSEVLREKLKWISNDMEMEERDVRELLLK